MGLFGDVACDNIRATFPRTSPHCSLRPPHLARRRTLPPHLAHTPPAHTHPWRAEATSLPLPSNVVAPLVVALVAALTLPMHVVSSLPSPSPLGDHTTRSRVSLARLISSRRRSRLLSALTLPSHSRPCATFTLPLPSLLCANKNGNTQRRVALECAAITFPSRSPTSSSCRPHPPVAFSSLPSRLPPCPWAYLHWLRIRIR